LEARGQDSEQVIQRRMREAQAEISHWDEFDDLVINDDFEKALLDLHAIIRSGNPKRRRTESEYREMMAELLGTR
jgi:guanylate kinase